MKDDKPTDLTYSIMRETDPQDMDELLSGNEPPFRVLANMRSEAGSYPLLAISTVFSLTDKELEGGIGVVEMQWAEGHMSDQDFAAAVDRIRNSAITGETEGAELQLELDLSPWHDGDDWPD